jgi:hypothetical protein
MIHRPIVPNWQGQERHHIRAWLSIKIEFHILEVWPKFHQTRKDSQIFELISGKLPLLLGQSLGGMSYGLVVTVKLL